MYVVTTCARRVFLTCALLASTFTAAYAGPPEVITTGGKGARIKAPTNSKRNAVVFRVQNTGTQTANYDVDCSVTGVLSNCKVIPSKSVRVEPGQFVRVAVRYTSGGAGSGAVTLTAQESAVPGRGPNAGEVLGMPPKSATYDVDVAPIALAGGGGGSTSVAVYINPMGGTFTAPGLDVLIDWCSTGSPLNASSRNVTFNGTNLTAGFGYTNYSFAECAQYSAWSNDWVTLAPGSNALSASIYNNAGAYGSSNALYEYTSSSSAPAAPSVSLAPNPNKQIARPACVTAGAGPAGAFQCGDLLLAHSMPSYRSMDRDRTLTLLYNSSTANLSPIIMADVSLGSNVSVPDRVDATLIVNGVQRAAHSFSNTGFTTGGAARRLAVGFDAAYAGLSTGVHNYTLQVSNIYGSTPYTTTMSGQFIIVDRRASPYGAGWGIAGVARLFGQGNGDLLLVDGDGSAKVYEHVGNYKYVAPPGAYRDTIEWQYVADGHVASGWYYVQRDLDATRTFFNGMGAQTYVRDRLNNKVEYTYTSGDPSSPISTIVISPHSLTLRYILTYDTNGKLSTLTDPSGTRTMYTSVNASNHLVSARDPGFAVGKEILFSYDGYNRLKTWRSRRGYTTKYVYFDASFGATGLLTADTLPVSPGGASAFVPVQLYGLGNSVLANTVRSDSAFVVIQGVRNDVARLLVNGNNAPTTIINPLGTMSRLEYDPSNPLLVTRIAQPAHNIVKTMGYDASARLTWAEDSTHSSGTRPRAEYQYDYWIREKPTHVIVPRTTLARDTTIYSYDSTNGWANSVRDSRGHTTTFGYFTNGQLQRITNPATQSTCFTYNSAGNLETVTTHLGNVTEYTYDGYGQLYTQSAPATGMVTIFRNARMNQQDSVRIADVTHGVLRTKFEYDDDGNLTRRTAPNEIPRSWGYNPLGFATSMTDELGQVEQRVYTADGLPLIVTNRDGSMIGIDYNALGQETLRQLQPSLGYGGSYDEIITERDLLGRAIRIENMNSKILRTYDPEGTVASEQQILKFAEAGGKQFKFEYDYNQGGARVEMRVYLDSSSTAARTVRYARGKDNVLDSLSWGSKQLRITYDNLGRRQNLYFPTGVNGTFSYDGDGRLTSVVGNGVDYQFTEFDGAGRPLMATRNGFGGFANLSWQYDSQGQIKAMNDGSTPFSYQYDKGGNRTIETIGGQRFVYEYVPGTNRLEERCASTTSNCTWASEWTKYSYNENGDMTRKQTHSGLDIPHYRTAAGQITTLASTQVQWRYDGLGRLVMRRDGNSMNRLTAYDGMNTGWHQGTFFFHGDGSDDPLVQSNATDCYFIAQGARLYSYVGDSGVNCSGSWETAGKFAGAISQSHSFGLSASNEATTEMSFFRNRWYDSKTGRFTQEDPMGFAGGSNLYAYAGNNPASFTDPFGLMPCPPCGPDGGPDWGALAKAWLKDRAADLGNLAAKFNAAVNPMASVVGGLLGRNPATGEKVGLLGAAALTATGAAGIADGPAIDIVAGRAALSRMMQGEFRVMAGAGVAREFRAARNLSGNAADWAYVTSKEVWHHGGYRYQAHWAVNTASGETAMAKLKLLVP